MCSWLFTMILTLNAAPLTQTQNNTIIWHVFAAVESPEHANPYRKRKRYQKRPEGVRLLPAPRTQSVGRRMGWIQILLSRRMPVSLKLVNPLSTSHGAMEAVGSRHSFDIIHHPRSPKTHRQSSRPSPGEFSSHSKNVLSQNGMQE